MQFYLESYCGKAFLRLIARGSTIVAELLRLSNNIPRVFFPNTNDHKKYKDLLFDFEYLRHIEEYDERISKLPNYMELEDQLFDRYSEIIERFMGLFESINRYTDDIGILISEIKDGFYVESIEDLLSMDEGKEVLSEAYYYLGVMLILLENLIPGPVREQIVTLHVRICGGQNAVENIHEICKLTKKTGFVPEWYTSQSADSKKSSFLNEISSTVDKEAAAKVNFTEKMFKRMKVNYKLVRALVLIIKDGDIYDTARNYIKPEHRSFALADQASLLYVLMFFIPDFLRDESAKMREIVDKHFYDNWVVPMFLGYLVDLTYEWRLYEAAAKAIKNTVQPKSITAYTEYYKERARVSVKALNEKVLLEGYLTKTYVLKELNNLMALVRDTNTSCRWLMLHRLARNPEHRQIVIGAAKIQNILRLLIYTAQYEQMLEKFVQELLKQKQDFWNKDRDGAIDNMSDLAELFSEKSTFKRIKPNKKYSEWFAAMQEKIASLDPEEVTKTSRKIQEYTRALLEIQKYDQIDNNVQVKDYIEETIKHLKKMITVLNLRGRLVTEIRQITDVSYCSLLLKEYVSHMQDVIVQDSKKTLMLRATFMKLSSIMNAPMNRLIMLSMLPEEEKEVRTKEEIRSVSMYYSAELMKFVRDVLQIIPMRVFGIANDLAKVLTPNIKNMPGEIEQKDLREFALFENRLQIAKYCKEIAVYTDGIMSMDRYIIGMIEVIPMKILEQGLRKELLVMLGGKLNEKLRFGNVKNYEQFEALLTDVGEEVDSLKRAVEYIQDMLNIQGLKIWYDEYNKLVTAYVDAEWEFLREEVLPDEALKWASSENKNESEANLEVDVSNLKKDEGGLTFCGRLINAVIKFCSPNSSTYLPKTLSFYSADSMNVRITMNTFMRIRKCIGANGLHAIDKLLGFMTLGEIYKVEEQLNKLQKSDRQNLEFDARNFGSLNNLFKDVEKLYAAAKKRLKPRLDQIMQSLEKIGLFYLLKTMIMRELQISAKADSQKTYLLIETMNDSLVNEVQHGRYDNLRREELEAEATVLSILSELSTRMGFTDPLNKVYFKPKAIEHIPIIMSFVLYNLIEYSKYNFNLSMIEASLPAGPTRVDPIRVLFGLYIYMNQYNDNSNDLVNQFIAFYIRGAMGDDDPKQEKDFNTRVFNSFMFCQFHVEFIRMLEINPETAEKIVPTSVMNKVSILMSRQTKK